MCQAEEFFGTEEAGDMAEGKVNETPARGPEHKSARGVVHGRRMLPELLADSLVIVAPIALGGPLFIQLIRLWPFLERTQVVPYKALSENGVF